MSDVFDDRVLIRFHRGDPDTFRHLIESHSPRLLALAHSFVRDDDDAHDLVQDTWFRIYRKRRDFSGRGAFLGWALSVCRNVCLDSVKKRAKRDRLSDVGIDSVPRPFDAHADADVKRNELRRSLRNSLLDLPPRERDVVVMRLVEGLTVRETAHRLDIAEGTVKATLHHALQKLRNTLEVWAR